MRRARRRRLTLVVLVAGALAIGTAFTATNIVAGSRVGFGRKSAGPNELKPAACRGLDLTTIRGVSPGGGNANALIIGTTGNDSIQGNGGDDCILGAAGNDFLRGNGGDDVCIGGPGLDLFHSTCETRIQ